MVLSSTSSFGNRFHWHPLRSRKMMPLSICRGAELAAPGFGRVFLQDDRFDPGHDQGQGRLADAAHAPHAGDGGACLHLVSGSVVHRSPDEVGRRRRELVEGRIRWKCVVLEGLGVP